MMNKLKVYQIATIGLLLLNVVLLSFIIFAPKPGGNGRPIKVMDHFGFDAAQDEKFLDLAKAHKAQIKATNDQQAELLQKYFLQLTTDEAANPGPLPPGIGMLEREKINSTYEHFLDIKEMLRPEQQEAFPSFVEAALQRILLMDSEKRPPPPKDR
jgi:hypothetical protein